MITLLVVGAGAAALTVACGLALPRDLAPKVAAGLTTTFAALGAVYALVALAFTSAVALLHLHGVAESMSWCHHSLLVHDGRLTPLGTGSVAALALASVSMSLVRRQQKQYRAARHGDSFVVVASDDALAFALPGKPGQVVVSTSMLSALNPAEQRVLFTHEEAHLRLHHHVYVRAAQLASAACPVAYPLLKRVRLATERWADEEAASAAGDRELVARTIARAALAAEQPIGGRMALAEGDVVVRIRALLGGPPPRRRSDGYRIVSMLALVAGAALILAVEAVNTLAVACG